jgi:hypothetical protein
MAIETIFEVAGFITSQDVLYFRMLVRYEVEQTDHFEFLFDIRRGAGITHEFLAVVEFGGKTPHVQFNFPPISPLAIRLLSCIAKDSIGPIISCYDKDSDVYLNRLKAKGLRQIGTATIGGLLDCFTHNGEGSKAH